MFVFCKGTYSFGVDTKDEKHRIVRFKDNKTYSFPKDMNVRILKRIINNHRCIVNAYTNSIQELKKYET
jgi:hypothetical protein